MTPSCTTCLFFEAGSPPHCSWSPLGDAPLWLPQEHHLTHKDISEARDCPAWVPIGPDPLVPEEAP